MCARDRVLKFIAYRGISKRQFYIKTGLSSGFLTKNKNIGSSKINKIVIAFPELRTEWIITGKGSMLTSCSSKNLGLDACNLLPLLDVPSLVKEQDISDKEALESIDHFFLGKSYKDCTLAVQVWGESMRPEFHPGDIAILKKLVDLEHIQCGFTHLVITEEQQFFKRVQRADQEDTLRMAGADPNSEFFEIPKKDIIHLYEVRAFVRKLMI